jgi:amino acid transporter
MMSSAGMDETWRAGMAESSGEREPRDPLGDERRALLKMEARSFGRILFLSGLFAFITILALPFAVAYLASQQAAYTDVLFPLLLITGVVSLLLAIAVLVGLYSRMHLTDRQHALGLPSGSISAILALMLILVFAMLSVLVLINLSYDVRTLTGLTSAQVNEIPAGDILRKECRTVDDCTIDRKVEKSRAAEDIGKQLVTTASTLVVAISAFYFGAAQSGRRRQRREEMPGNQQ